jgi:hypothetical protein
MKNESLVFKQGYDTLNFTMNMTDMNPPVFECPAGQFIVQSNLSDKGYICQTY